MICVNLQALNYRSIFAKDILYQQKKTYFYPFIYGDNSYAGAVLP